MYDRRAIMIAAHRAYEARAEGLQAWVNGKNAERKKSRAARKPPLLDMGAQLGALWRCCLRHAWDEAKRAARPVAPQSPRERVLVALAYEEAAERGYRANIVAGLRAELLALAA